MWLHQEVLGKVFPAEVWTRRGRSVTRGGALLGDSNIARNEKQGPDQRALTKEAPPGSLADKQLEEDGRGIKKKKMPGCVGE